MLFDESTLSAALAGAVAYGAGDFLGSRAATRISTFSAIAIGQTIAAVYIIQVFMQSGQSVPGGSLLGPCIVAGCAYVTGLALLYRGLADGQIGIVAPLCALFSILVPLAGDFHLHRLLDGRLLLGVAFCMASAVLIASSSRSISVKCANPSVMLGITSGLGYGLADLIMGLMPASDASSALLVMRLVAASLAVAAAAILLFAGGRISRHTTAGGHGAANASLAITYSFARVVVAPITDNSHRAVCTGTLLAGTAGVLDLLGQMGYVAAATQGRMGIAAALVGLFPGVSILLAVIILRERIGSTQILGLAVGGTGVLLVSS